MDQKLKLYYIKKNALSYASAVTRFIKENKYTNNILAVAWLSEKLKKKGLPVYLELKIDVSNFSSIFKDLSNDNQKFHHFIEEKCVVKVFEVDSSLENDDLKIENLSDEVKEVIDLNEMNHTNSGFILHLMFCHLVLGEIFETIEHIRIDIEGPSIHYVSPTSFPRSKIDRVNFVDEVKKRLGSEHFKKVHKQFEKEFKDYRNQNKGTKILTLVEKDHGEKLKKGHIVAINLLKSEDQ